MVVADSSTVSSVRAAVDGLADALQAADDQRRARTPVPLWSSTGCRCCRENAGSPT
jgi:hypothetical protein